jgi:hypothetical protein
MASSLCRRKPFTRTVVVREEFRFAKIRSKKIGEDAGSVKKLGGLDTAAEQD